jgi:hypothetical protein
LSPATALGEKKRRQLDLLDREPLCIFCGGAVPASTGDHQPARALFDAKHAPEGYEFPACEPCNKKSKDHEHVLTTLVRLKGDGAPDAQREVDFAKFAKAMRNNFPGLLRVLGHGVGAVAGLAIETRASSPALPASSP